MFILILLDLDGFLVSFSKFGFVILENRDLVGLFLVMYEYFSMLWLRQRGHNFSAGLADVETISSLAESTPNKLSRIPNQRSNYNSFTSGRSSASKF
jgi:hypothetical protein